MRRCSLLAGTPGVPYGRWRARDGFLRLLGPWVVEFTEEGVTETLDRDRDYHPYAKLMGDLSWLRCLWDLAIVGFMQGPSGRFHYPNADLAVGTFPAVKVASKTIFLVEKVGREVCLVATRCGVCDILQIPVPVEMLAFRAELVLAFARGRDCSAISLPNF